ncbi:DUF4397 domain-containing protein [Mucilaginibacter sp. dw_454]|uniref:DUF4397 domain-containing protein n=1 Tax=Mucilaginibacter sp. dw_454 TaxID=2720079 RepID=UPI001BD3E655|nr:DUF4397 domain-containing protein [Mucilaginibacter sp. dw_454]
MKKLIFIPLIMIAIIAITSCKKSATVFIPAGSLLVANNVTNGGTLTFNSDNSTISNNGIGQYPLSIGMNQINLYTAATSTVPAVTYYKQPLTITNSDRYSLFLAGTSLTAIDPVLIKESYINPTDSLCGVRFINLSPNSSPISVNITGQTNGSEVSSLAYKAYSSFKQYPAKKANASYAFQIKDATTGTTITSYTLTTPRFHNVTIVLRGLVGGSPAAGVTLVTHP